MLKLIITCDFCGKEIKGEYRKIRQEFTDKPEPPKNYNDMCMSCLKMVTDYQRVPLVSFGDDDAALQ